MATASNDVRVSITYRGIDQTKKASRGARKAIGGVGGAAAASAAKIKGLQTSLAAIGTGDILGGVDHLRKTFAGPTGIAGTAAAAAAGVTAFGAAAAVASVKIVNMTIETNRLAAAADDAFGLTGGKGIALALDIAEKVGGVGAENIAALAGRIKTSGLAANITANQLVELETRARTMGKSGDEALQAFAKAIETGRTRALASVGVFVDAGAAATRYAKEMGIATTEVTELERRQIALNLILQNLDTQLDRQTTLYDKQDSAIASLGNSFLRLKVQIAEAIGGEAAKGVDTLRTFTDAVGEMSNQIIATIRAALLPFSQMIQRVGATVAAVAAASVQAAKGNFGAVQQVFSQYLDDTRALNRELVRDAENIVRQFDRTAKQVASSSGAIQIEADKSAAAAASAAQIAARQASAAEKARAKAAIARKKRIDRARQAAQAADKSEIDLVKARIARATSFGAVEADLFDERLELIRLEEQAQIKAARRAVNTAQGREDQITSIVLAAETKRIELKKRLDDAALQSELDADQAMFDQLEADTEKIVALNKQAEESAKKAADARRTQLQEAAKDALDLQNAIGATTTTVGNALAAMPALAAGVSTAFSDSKTAIADALSIGQSAVMGFIDAEKQREVATASSEEERAAAVERAERRKAAILAIMSAAQAALAFASGNIPGGVAAGTAAALYAGVAGGAIKTASGTGAGVAGTGTTTGGGQTVTTTTADEKPAAPITISFGSGFVFGTKQQVGKAVAGSIRSLRTTGLAVSAGV